MTIDLPTYTVAVVDDDASMLRSAVRFLQTAGYVAKGFTSAAEFLDMIGASVVDCAIIDVQMPRLNGFELSTELEKRGIKLPIFYMTAHDSPWTRDQVAEHRGQGLLIKPFNPQRLLDVLASMLKPGGSA